LKNKQKRRTAKEDLDDFTEEDVEVPLHTLVIDKRTAVKQKKKEYDSRPEAKARRRRSTHAWQMRKKQERLESQTKKET
jgi:hypothetical protein